MEAVLLSSRFYVSEVACKYLGAIHPFTAEYSVHRKVRKQAISDNKRFRILRVHFKDRATPWPQSILERCLGSLTGWNTYDVAARRRTGTRSEFSQRLPKLSRYLSRVTGVPDNIITELLHWAFYADPIYTSLNEKYFFCTVRHSTAYLRMLHVRVSASIFNVVLKYKLSLIYKPVKWWKNSYFMLVWNQFDRNWCIIWNAHYSIGCLDRTS